MKRASGIELIEDREGEGRPAQKGDRVIYNTRLFLNKGDEVPLNEKQVEYVAQDQMRVESGAKLIDRTVTLGRREVIAGVELALIGMKVGGYRKVRISPHLAYREKGIPDLIPSNAVLVAEIWLREIIEERKVRPS